MVRNTLKGIRRLFGNVIESKIKGKIHLISFVVLSVLTDCSGPDVQFDSNRTENGRGGGVSIYIRDSIRYTRCNDLPNNKLELICIEIEPKSRSFFIVACYRPSSEPVDIFAKLQQILPSLDREGKEIILLGDTNCNLSNHAQGQSVANNV